MYGTAITSSLKRLFGRAGKAALPESKVPTPECDPPTTVHAAKTPRHRTSNSVSRADPSWKSRPSDSTEDWEAWVEEGYESSRWSYKHGDRTR